MTDNGVRVEGAKAISEMLKVNTTLTELNLSSVEERKNEKKKGKKNECQIVGLETKVQKQ